MEYVPLPSYEKTTLHRVDHSKVAPAAKTPIEYKKTEYNKAVQAKITQNKHDHWLILPIIVTVGITSTATLAALYTLTCISIIKNKKINRLKFLALIPTLYPLSIVQLAMYAINKTGCTLCQNIAITQKLFVINTCLLFPALACLKMHHKITHKGITEIPKDIIKPTYSI
jgi:hypothetical protein